MRHLVDGLRRAEGFEAIRRARRIGGLWGSSPALVLTALREGGGSRPPDLCVVPEPEEAEDLAQDLRLLLEGEDRAAVFPALESWEPDPEKVDPALLGNRLRVVESLERASGPWFVVAAAGALVQPLPAPDRLARGRTVVQVGRRLDIGALAALLEERGFVRVPMVERPGDWSLRGGILDVFPLTREAPWRIELWDEDVESIRRFEPATQRSLGHESRAQVTLLPREDLVRPSEPATLVDHLPAGSRVWWVEPERIRSWVERLAERLERPDLALRLAGIEDELDPDRRRDLTSSPLPEGPETARLAARSIQLTVREAGGLAPFLATVLETARLAVVFCNNPAERHRVESLLEGAEGLDTGCVQVRTGRLSHSFLVEETGVAFLSHDAMLGRQPRRRLPAARPASRPITDLADLREGDFVVHLTHGIGLFRGLERIVKQGEVGEFLKLEFRDGVEVYVPSHKANLVQRYIGTKDLAPRLSRVGGKEWANRKEKVGQAVLDVAADLLDVQAARSKKRGIAYPEDDVEQHEFESAFLYEDTPDQIEVTRAVKDDMTSSRPMDRLICGDVGYGKTEIAMRAAFKAVCAGRQVAVLVPTTVLAQQHHQSFSERMAEWPVNVDVLSRFRTKAEQKRILERTGAGGVDILIGTHRLVQKDVVFRNLGLVIIDEEQRFGVDAKERLKRLRRMVDVLTLTATPIPRTLHMAMLGIRDISSLATPPTGRQSVRTEVRMFDRSLVRNSILREIHRNGQVFFVHNRVQTIDRIADEIREIVPEARLAVVHGQMKERLLEDRMMLFLKGAVDVLVTTTIIESGLDIPKANTILIDRADMYGLADLHQLRGRVGRYKNRAHCYLLLRPGRPPTREAEKRLRALEEFSELGAGFRIAMRDLEIRGAGNILGVQQSGHIAAVGYDLYCRLLEEAVESLKGGDKEPRTEAFVELPVEAHLPDTYVPDEDQRISLYRRLARAAETEELDRLRGEMRDRFGPEPEAAAALVRLAAVRIAAEAAAIRSLTAVGGRILLRTDDLRRTLEALAGVHDRVRVIEKGLLHLLPSPGADLLAFLESALAGEDEPYKVPEIDAATAEPIVLDGRGPR
jgi:transcription-repair coupling factor (superfamily II helicase)